MLQVVQLKKTFGAFVLFDDVSFGVNAGERVALVGPNGAGKSTLLRIVTGELRADGGQVARTAGKTIGYLPQVASVQPGRTLYGEMLEVFQSVREVEARLQHTAEQLRSLAGDDPRLPALIDEHTHLLAELDRLGGHTVEAQIGTVLAGLGFAPEDYDRPTEQFSGGWQMRIALAKLLLQKPDLLLLDEPTNHLDLAATEWLEDYLRATPGAVLVVSHDRYFLNRLTTRTLELDRGQITDYPGAYEWYVQERARRREALAAAARRQQEYLAKQQAFVERFRANANRSAQAKSREKLLARIERIEAPRESPTIRFRFPPSPPSGREAVRVRSLTKEYDGNVVFADVSFLFERGDRVGVVGPNGAGKSTLLRLLAGREKATSGIVILGQNVQRGYFAQDQAEVLDPTKTVLDQVIAVAPNGTATETIRTTLGGLLFRQDDVFKRIADLSGGERSRVALARLAFQPANLLLLDEPTNHLDVSAKEVLEEALAAFEGTVVVASHDRYLLDRIATKILEIDGGAARLYLGNYSAYRAQRAAGTPPLPAPTTDRGRPASPQPERAAPTKAKRPAADGQAKSGLDAEIARLEAQIAALEEALADPEVERDRDRSNRLIDEYVIVGGKLDELRARKSRG